MTSPKITINVKEAGVAILGIGAAVAAVEQSNVLPASTPGWARLALLITGIVCAALARAWKLDDTLTTTATTTTTVTTPKDPPPTVIS